MGWFEERLNEQFVAWSLLGTGSLPASEHPVTPEPPFLPFNGYVIPRQPYIDDGRRHTGISSFLAASQLNEVLPQFEAEPPYFRDLNREQVSELQIQLPQKVSLRSESLAQFILNLDEATQPLSFELIGSHEGITLQFAGHPRDMELLQRQAGTYFPEALLLPAEGFLQETWSQTKGDHFATSECALESVPHFSLKTKGVDPLVGLLASLSNLSSDEIAIVQVLFEPTQCPWSESLLHTTARPDGKPVFTDGADLIRQTRDKLSSPLYAVSIRFAVRSANQERLHLLTRELLSSLNVTRSLEGNGLSLLHDGSLDPSPSELFLRQSRRHGMLLNLSELITFVRFPDHSYASGRIKELSKTRQAPQEVLQRSGLVLGSNEHRGQTSCVALNQEQRVRHMQLIGASGTGKSNLIANLVRQDIENGQGLALLDPHGDLIDLVLKSIPKHREKDVILFDPSDEEFPIGFNVLSAHSELEKTILASDLCSIFRKFATSWGDNMDAILSSAILAFLESKSGGTLFDLRRFLVEKPFRAQVLADVEDEDVNYFWNYEYPLIGGRSEASIVTRLNTFLRPKIVRYMIAQQANTLDFSKVMSEGKIFLGRIPKGLVGEENAYLLGSLLVTKFHQAVMGRQQEEVADRRPFWLYIDEFHHFITESMTSILSGARKYNLGMCLAHQDLHQLENKHAAIANSVSTNSYTRVVFRVGDQDARKLEDGFNHFDRHDLQSLSIGHAVCRVGGAENDFTLKTDYSPPEHNEALSNQLERIREHSRATYATPKAEVAKQLPSGKKVAKQASPPKEAEKKQQEPRPEKSASPQNTPPPPEEKPPVVAAPPQPPSEQATAVAPPDVPDVEPSTAKKSTEDLTEQNRLQKFIQKYAEGLNFLVQREVTTPDGKGRIDLVLRRSEIEIAVEISVTNKVPYEIQNLQKCLDAGYPIVFSICEDRAKLAKIEEKAQKTFPVSEFEKLAFATTSQFSEILLEVVTNEQSEVKQVDGWTLKTTFVAPPQEVRDELAKRVSKIIGDAARRKGKSDSTRPKKDETS